MQSSILFLFVDSLIKGYTIELKNYVFLTAICLNPFAKVLTYSFTSSLIEFATVKLINSALPNHQLSWLIPFRKYFKTHNRIQLQLQMVDANMLSPSDPLQSMLIAFLSYAINSNNNLRTK